MIFLSTSVDALREKNQHTLYANQNTYGSAEATNHVQQSQDHVVGKEYEGRRIGQRRRRLIHEGMIEVGPGGGEDRERIVSRRLTNKHVLRVSWQIESL